MIRKIFIQGNYIIITDNSDKELYSAPASSTKVKPDDSNKILIYNKTISTTNYQSVVIDITQLKDENGDALEGGALPWLYENTGFNSASGGSGAEILALQEGKTDKGGYAGTAQDLKDQLDAIAGGSQGFINTTDVKTEIGYYYPTESGTYTNAGGLVVDLTEGVTILIFDGTNWGMQVVPVDLANYAFSSETFGITTELVDVDSEAITLVQPTITQNGFVSPTTGAFTANANFRVSEYNILQGVVYLATGHVNASITCLAAYYDLNGNFISSQFTGPGVATNYSQEPLTTPPTAVKVIITGRLGQNLPLLHFEGEKRYYNKTEIQNRELVVENKANVIYDADSELEKIKQFPVEEYIDLAPNLNGVLTNAVPWVSKKYYVEQGETYYATGRTNSVNRCLAAYYDIDGIFISAEFIGTGENIDFTQQEITIPVNAHFTIITGRINFPPYLYKESPAFIFAGKTQVLPNPFDGMKFSVLGDSISYGFIPRNYTGYPGQLNSYAKLAAETLGMEFTNFGLSGSTLGSLTIDGTENNPFVYRYDDIPDNQDLIVVMGGTNDIRKGIDLGTFSDTDETTFYGALHVLCLGLINKFKILQGTEIGKTKHIVFCTPIKLGIDLTPDIRPYCEAIKEVCAFYSIPVWDAYNLSGINPHIFRIIEGTETGYTDDYNPYITDGTHPTQEGHQIMADAFVGFLKTIL